MLRHPLWIGGWLIVVAGFGLLIFWAPVSVRGYGMESQPVLNLHRLEISRGLMWIGFVLSVSGAIIEGFTSLREARAASPATGIADEDLEPEMEEDLEPDMNVVTIKDRQGRDDR
ncbi:hypothetical protein [Rubellimicrobium sp. CFH 75288]|uniref:hypothetical protein n=1 Tax=Rubellimicrobium sp. CFH 75288 TaxID=2697034 RepID=UPI001412BB6A|nr:hypothetical protein [Rubellimicrobium sp. CFH 75288]NAZ35882.1 hypothetical protein [Rubellimicrobium sp. CFH 75288]